MFGFLKKSKSAGGHIGVSVSERGVGLASFADLSGEKPRLSILDYAPHEEPLQPLNTLHALLKKHKILNAKINIVLSPPAYELHLIDAIEVDETEIREAARWRVKDLVSFPVETAIIDAFHVYEKTPPGRRNMSFVVAAAKEQLDPFVKFAKEHDLEINALDIRELALRNLMQQFVPEEESVAVLTLEDTSGYIFLFQSGRIFFTRMMDIGLQKIEQGDDYVWEDLALEIQRSLDYYESRFAQRPASNVLLCPMGGLEDKIIEELSPKIPVGLNVLHPHAFLEFDESQQINDVESLVAIGGALRQDQEVSST